MSEVYISHARMDENGKIDGLIPGDQTGKEIEVRPWYNSNWVYYIECTDTILAAKAAANAKQIALDSAFGYSQNTRWTGYTSIKNNNGNIKGAGGNLDCASLVITAYIIAGLNIKATGYTASLKGIFEKTGKFKVYTDAAHISKCLYAKVGALYVRPRTAESGGHVCIVLNDGVAVIPTPVEDIAEPYVQALGTVIVREGGSTAYRRIGTTKSGNKYPYKGRDPYGANWFIIDFNGKEGHVSSNPKYTKLITR